MTSKDECRCEYGYYCRFCRLMDHRDEQIKYEKNDYNIQEPKPVDNHKTVLEQLFNTANFIKCQDK